MLISNNYLTFDDVLLLPNYSEITPSKVNISTVLTNKIKLKIPLVSSPMDTVTEEKMALAVALSGGIGIIHRNLTIFNQANQVKKIKEKKLLVGAAIGVGIDLEERINALVKAGVDVLVIDSSHGHTKQIINTIKTIKNKYPQTNLIAGNIATKEAARDLIAVGADALRVGMGPGSICTTRIMSGMGVPQLSAISETVKEAKKSKIPVIADGGIRSSGDIVKALALGATTVMIGSLFAGCDESPGKMVIINGKKYKYYRGMGSVAAMKKGGAQRYGQKYQGNSKKLVPEGIEGLVKYKGKVKDFVYQLLGGIRAGMGYLGAKNLKELSQKARFIQITNASLIESKPHSILINKKYL